MDDILYKTKRQLYKRASHVIRKLPDYVYGVLLALVVVTILLTCIQISTRDAYTFSVLNAALGLAISLGCFGIGAYLNVEKCNLVDHIVEEKKRVWDMDPETIEKVGGYERCCEEKFVRISTLLAVFGFVMFIFVLPQIQIISGLNLQLLFFLWFDGILVMLSWSYYQVIAYIEQLLTPADAIAATIPAEETI